MQVWDIVKVKTAPEGRPEMEGRAGIVQALAGADDAQVVTVRLDQSTDYAAEDIDLPVGDLEFVGRG